MADPVSWGFLIVSAGSAIYDAYQQYDEYGNAIDDQEAAYEAQKKLNEANWTAAKANAEQSAVDLGKNAAQTQVVADKNRNLSNTMLGRDLGIAAVQSIQGNKQISSLAIDVSKGNSSLSASFGASGVKRTGSAAEATKEAAAFGTDQIVDAKKSIFAGIRGTASGAALGTETNENAYGAAMYDKNSMLQKAQEIRDSYAEGGTAYEQYQAGADYASTINEIQTKALERKQDDYAWYSPSTLLGATAAGLNGFSMGLQFQNSYTNYMNNLASGKAAKAAKAAEYSPFSNTKWNWRP